MRIIGPVRAQELVYRLTVTLDRQTVDVFGRQVAIQPDVSITADIFLEERSIPDLLLAPRRAIQKRKTDSTPNIQHPYECE